MAYPTVSITGDPVPSDWQMNITVEVVEQFTERSPARLRIGFTNEAPARREFLSNSGSPYDELVGRSKDGKKVHALPDGPGANSYSRMIPESPTDGCWKLASSYGSEGFGTLWPAEPEATRSITYVVLDEPDTADCLPPGQYRFECEWEEVLPDNEDVRHSWGFTVELQR